MDKFLMILAFVLLVILTTSVNSEECPSWYLRYSKDHTYCQPANDKCEVLDSNIRDDDKEIILMEHNRIRSMVAMGEAENLPGASNMLQMEWDEELAEIAQRHANRCNFNHDCADCRKCKNFPVGQNIAMEQVSTVLRPPQPDWMGACGSWWKERKNFKSKHIIRYAKPNRRHNFAHFSQLIWANTWKIGCGYVMFREGNNYNKFYVCNYGPEGNLLKSNVYEKGEPCSQCPENTCCGENCDKTEYEGLCKLHTGNRPIYRPKGEYLFYCNFEGGQQDCDTYVNGVDKWRKYETLSGKFLGIVLNPGEDSTLMLQKHIIPSSDYFCVVMNYRKGPNMDGDEESLDACENFYIIPEKQNVEQPLKNFGGVLKHRHNSFGATMDWNLETEMSIKLKVPEDGKPQFFEVTEIYAINGQCEEDE